MLCASLIMCTANLVPMTAAWSSIRGIEINLFGVTLVAAAVFSPTSTKTRSCEHPNPSSEKYYNLIS